MKARGARGRGVVHLTTVHDPRDTRIQKQCHTLADAGFDVTLVATRVTGGDVQGVPAVSLPSPGNRRERMLTTTRQAYRAARALEPAVFHIHDPELIPVGAALRRFGRVVYDVHEDYPSMMLEKEWILSALRPAVSGTVGMVERLIGHRFDLIVAATPPIARTFPAGRTVIVQNFPMSDELFPTDAVAFSNRELAVAYVGDVTTARGGMEMVRAIAIAAEQVDVRLLVAGRVSTPGLDAAMAAASGGERTVMLGFQSRTAVRDLLGRVRAGLVILHPTPNHVMSQPTKLYEYMSAGIPVICSDFPLCREVIETHGCGILVDPLDPGAIAEAIVRIVQAPEEAEEMGRRGRQAVLAQYNWDMEGTALVGAYKKLVA